MKKFFLIIILILLFSGIDLSARAPALAAWGKKKIEAKPGTDSSRANQELGRKEWIIYVLPQDPNKLKLQTTDVLTFSGGKFVSQNLSAQGYPAADYTLAVREEGAIVWGAQAGNERGGLVAWKGELKGETMHGVFSIASLKGELEDFSFTSATLSR